MRRVSNKSPGKADGRISHPSYFPYAVARVNSLAALSIPTRDPSIMGVPVDVFCSHGFLRQECEGPFGAFTVLVHPYPVISVKDGALCLVTGAGGLQEKL